MWTDNPRLATLISISISLFNNSYYFQFQKKLGYMNILVGSENRVKVEAVSEAFGKFYSEVEVLGIGAPSGVSDQPFNEETYKGAENRAKFLFDSETEADFYVGIEGGVQQISGIWFGFGAVCIIDNLGNKGFGASPQYELPEEIITQLRKGKELGHVIDEISGKNDTKHKGGAIGFLTNEIFQRKDLYVSGVIVALVPLLNKSIYFDEA